MTRLVVIELINLISLLDINRQCMYDHKTLHLNDANDDVDANDWPGGWEDDDAFLSTPPSPLDVALKNAAQNAGYDR